MAYKISRMVKRWKKAKRTRKAAPAARSYKRRRVTKVPTQVTMGRGFPKKLQFTHVYDESTLLTSTLGVPANFVYSCNGLFDPDITGGGHQPYYFDQLTALYDHYVVIGSKIEYSIVASSNTDKPFKVGCFVNDDLTVTANKPTYMGELPQGKMGIVPMNPGSVKRLSMKWSAKKYFGGSVLANTELQGSAAGNPTEQSYFVLGLQAMDETSTVNIYVNVKVTYIAVWKELKDIAQS